MTERETIERALAYYDEKVALDGSYLSDLMRAARKHLDTLPKTKTEWRVSHNAGGDTWRITDTESEALESASYALACGKRYVCIDKRVVPA